MSNSYFFPIYLIIFLLPSVAVTVDSSISSAFYVLSIIGLIGLWFGERPLHLKEKYLLIGFLIFAICIVLSLFNAESFSNSIGPYEKYFRFVLFIPIYLFVRRQDIVLAPLLKWGSIFGCLVMACVAIYQFHILDISRPHGVRHPTRFGFILMMMCLLVWLQMIFYKHEKKMLIAGVIISFLVLYVMALNHTRAAMLMVFPFFALLIFYYRNNFNKKSLYIILGISVITLLIFTYPSSPIAQHFYKGFSELALLIEDPKANFFTSWGVRVHMVYVALLIFIQSPILGTGLGDYASDAQQLMDTGKTLVSDPWLLNTPHNVYVNLLAETGLVGLLSMLIFVCFVPAYIYLNFLNKYHNNKEISLYCLSGLTVIACYMLFALTNTWLTNNTISIYLVLNLVYISSIFIILEENHYCAAK
jgi:O-antigen ligase